MTQMLPSLQAQHLRDGLLDFLTTTFALSDTGARHALGEFLDDEQDGIFKGPYVRIRLPFTPAEGDSALDWEPPFPPYRHQAEAYRRLSSKDRGPDKPRPLPTIVTTGTGSGKTEAFLDPIIDHVLRANRNGERGMKALILYPMNALADDQALRLTKLITGDPALQGVRAGLYTGDATDGQSIGRTRVTKDGLITNREEMRHNPPDILLTNYKMLDQLLLRPEDAGIWKASALSLRYLVLDEFHTYDGAQGTDVAMLLRRLGLVLKGIIETDHADHPDLHELTARPLGAITPVATSATLGSGHDPSAMLAFAEQVFGEAFPPDAAITESRLSLEQFCPEAGGAQATDAHLRSTAAMFDEDIEALADLGATLRADGEQLVEGVVAALYDNAAAHGASSGGNPMADAATALRAHPDVKKLIGAAHDAVPMTDLTGVLFGQGRARNRAAQEATAVILAALSHIRGALGRSEASIEVTMWVREVTRVDRYVGAVPKFRWSDDGDVLIDSQEGDTALLPAIYCRSCGRSGWGVGLAATGRDLAPRDDTIRADKAAGRGRFRALISGAAEAARVEQERAEGGRSALEIAPSLRWLDMVARTIHLERPAGDETRAVPVIMLDGDDEETERRSRRDLCPSCDRADSIRFLGSAMATLISTSLTTLFGDEHLDSHEKRALIFTDSVQDAAQRAGFVEARSYAMSLRAGLRSALVAPMTVPEWAAAAMKAAGDDEFARYRLVPPGLAEHPQFKDYWASPDLKKVSARTKKYVQRRLLFDAVLEAGLQSTFGRTLEATGSASVHVDVGSRESLLTLARRLLVDPTIGYDTAVDIGSIAEDDALLRWVRGTVECLRRDGGIEHEWLDRYIADDGQRFRIWGGRPRNEGMPAFPPGRSAPRFVSIGGKSDENSEFIRATSPRSWYAQWAAKCLGVSAAHGASLASRLLRDLAQHGLLHESVTKRSATVYGIPAQRVIVAPLDEAQLGQGRSLLVCTVCASQLPTAPEVFDQLHGARCFAVRCPGSLVAAPREGTSFYRTLFASPGVRRVNAQEHTSLLPGKERRAIEEGFKARVQKGSDPNVLVATPTLEMGIDIGDLTTVMLSSLPDSVAKYTQRVGRAGRLTGSSLAMAYITGRSDQLPRLGDPTSMINGDVRPPATYLDAEEILRRQFVAFVIDTMVRGGYSSIPRTTGKVCDQGSENTFLDDVLATIKTDPSLLVRFTSAFPDVDQPGLAALRAWVNNDGVREDINGTIYRLVAEYQRDLEALQRRKRDIEKNLPALQVLGDAPNATKDDKEAFNMAKSAKGLVTRQLSDMRDAPWISGLELRGLLPNYSLIDDSVELDVHASWWDPESETYVSQDATYNRGSARALDEFAPGATFYARGHQMTVNGIEISNDDSEITVCALCDTCGYVADLIDAQAPSPTSCPRCGSTGIADYGRRFESVRLRRVFSDTYGEATRIDDRDDDRTIAHFEKLTMADFDPELREEQWAVKDLGLGLASYRRLPIRTFNLGVANAAPRTTMLGGCELSAQLFRVCEVCGKLDRGAGVNAPSEHRAWCSNRKKLAEATRELALHRELVTQGVAISLPNSVTGSLLGVPSLAAAFKLGLQEFMGGSPDHLGVVSVPHPLDTGTGEARTALLIHDTVPGGTGYLADLHDPRKLWRILLCAARVLESCECATEERTCCHRCLLPFTREPKLVSRIEALEGLRVLLGADDDTRFADVLPDAPTWDVVHESIDPNWGLSPIEITFRNALSARVKQFANVLERAASTGIELAITGAGHRSWTLRQQVGLGSVRPDFVLASGGLPSYAIFTDGAAFHAGTRDKNRLGDDAMKRQRLRDQGYRVLAVTHQDIESLAHKDDGQGLPAMSWLAPEITAKLMHRGISQGAVEEQRAGSLELLAGLIAEPESPARNKLGAILPLLMGGDQTTTSTAVIGEGDSLPHVADATLKNVFTPIAGNDQPVVVYQRPHLIFVARIALVENPASGAREYVSAEYALLLDDDEAAVGSDGFRDSWREWLRLSNAIAFSSVPAWIGTTSILDTVTSVASDGATLRGEWAQLDTELLDPALVKLAALLSADDVPAPQDIEVSGILVDFAWPQEKVAVLYPDSSEDDAETVRRQGWKTIVASHDDITETQRLVMQSLHPQE